MKNTLVRLERERGIARIVFNRPEQLNAINVDTAKAFDKACEAIEHDSTVRVVVISGEGTSFGVGGDLRSFTASPQTTALEIIKPMHRGLLRLTQMAAPILASLHGNVSGGSMSLAMACDIAIASSDTRFNLAYVNVAASCDVGGSWHLARLVGMRRAMEIALLSPTLNAEDALRLGLVNQVVPASEITEATNQLAMRLENGPTAAYGRIKRLIRASQLNDLPTQLDLEKDGFYESAGTADFKDALQAFFERRPPQFNGR